MDKWRIDPDHSDAAFAVRHMMVTNVRGQFNKVTGTINFSPSDISHSSVEAEIDAASLTTGNQKRDDHLRSADFFEVAKYPKITFKSTKVEAAGPQSAKISGDLSIHGVTKPVSFDAQFAGPIKSPLGGEITIGFTAVLKINREDYGVMWNEAIEGGGVVVGNEVEIHIDIEADKVS